MHFLLTPSCAWMILTFHSSRPERWLTPMPDELRRKQKQIPSVFSDLMTFTGGPRSCIGWKFAVVEYALFITLLFETS